MEEATVERGDLIFSVGDRVMFLKNERGIGVKNGSLGSVQAVNPIRMAVMLDDGRSVAFDLKDYAHVDHGYAATIHKAQGMTVDRVQLLATPGIDSHSTYVAMSRHREQVDLHYGRDDFSDRGKLIRAASRERGKDMASDYPARDKEQAVRSEPRRDIFAGLGLRASRAVEAVPTHAPLNRAVERYARAAQQIIEVRRAGGKELQHETEAFRKAARDLEALRPDGARDLRAAMLANDALVKEAAAGRTVGAIAAMEGQRAARIADRAATERAARERATVAVDTERRADLFVATWKKESTRANEAPTYAARDEARASLSNMAKSLHRDPQLESLLENRRAQLGLDAMRGKSLSHDLQQWIGRSLGRGMSM